MAQLTGKIKVTRYTSLRDEVSLHDSNLVLMPSLVEEYVL